MKEVIAIIRPEKWQPTREALEALGVLELAHYRVLGRGRQRGLRYLRRVTRGRDSPGTMAAVSVQFLPKRLVSWLIPDERLNELLGALIRVNQTGNIGDGKVFVCPVETISVEAA
jgi:nitrogen regulatory protein PII 2